MNNMNNIITKSKLFDKRMLIIILSQLIISILLALFLLFYKGNLANNKTSGDEINYLRTIGNKLQSVELNLEAAKAYEKYFEQSIGGIDNETKAKLAFTIGELYKNESQFEKAISYYMQVELFDSNSSYKNDAKKEIIAILEKLKKFSAAKWMLNEATSLNSTSTASANTKANVVNQGGDVVAKIGDKKIYLHEINSYLDDLPEFIRKNFTKKEEKENFVKKYVADTLLYEKAKRQSMDKDSKYIQQIERIQRELLLQKIIEQEVTKKVTISDPDVKNYFEANKDKFAPKNKSGAKTAAVTAVKFEEVKKLATDSYRQEKEQAIYQKLIEETLKMEKVEFFPEKIK
ncbi:MAG: hypothetical protein HQK51_21505 [Oligoflexia bacterium]|nr:hypothetical protein [Oligoflexia bacterium]